MRRGDRRSSGSRRRGGEGVETEPERWCPAARFAQECNRNRRLLSHHRFNYYFSTPFPDGRVAPSCGPPITILIRELARTPPSIEGVSPSLALPPSTWLCGRPPVPYEHSAMELHRVPQGFSAAAPIMISFFVCWSTENISVQPCTSASGAAEVGLCVCVGERSARGKGRGTERSKECFFFLEEWGREMAAHTCRAKPLQLGLPREAGLKNPPPGVTLLGYRAPAAAAGEQSEAEHRGERGARYGPRLSEMRHRVRDAARAGDKERLCVRARSKTGLKRIAGHAVRERLPSSRVLESGISRHPRRYFFSPEIRTEKKGKEIQRSNAWDGEWKGPGRQSCSGPHSNGKNRNERRCFSRFCGLFV